MNTFDIWLITMIVSMGANFILVALLFVKVFEKREVQEKLNKNNHDFLKVINTLKTEQKEMVQWAKKADPRDVLEHNMNVLNDVEKYAQLTKECDEEESNQNDY